MGAGKPPGANQGERHVDYDQDALYSLPSAPTDAPTDRGTCYACGRKMHKTLLQPGAATQWHHDSTGHAISWSPSRHTAALTRVKVHAHRWQPHHAPENILRCTVTPCDAEMLDSSHAKVHVELSEKQQHVAESRRRGGESRRAQTKAKTAA